jgi:hypothetical protein
MKRRYGRIWHENEARRYGKYLKYRSLHYNLAAPGNGNGLERRALTTVGLLRIWYKKRKQNSSNPTIHVNYLPYLTLPRATRKNNSRNAG